MPLSLTRPFRVRYYECDANGHLNNANYLRYMQETAFDASAAAGYGMERYDEMQRFWLIRESQVEYLCPLHYNDRVNITTWIADFRRISSRRAYEFRRAETDELVARAYTDWVFINSQTNMPASIPSALALDFCPEGLPESFPPRQPFPKPPAPPAGVFTTCRKVAWQDLDSMQHVNNTIYMNYITECSFQAAAAFGWPWERMYACGFGIYVRRSWIQYLQPAMLNDELEISTWVSGVRRSMATRHYTLRRLSDGALICQADNLSVWVDLKSGRPVRIPKQFLADFGPNIAPS